LLLQMRAPVALTYPRTRDLLSSPTLQILVRPVVELRETQEGTGMAVDATAESFSLPRFFCWTRYGTEAGENIGDIVARKERERIANGGTFLWGIGNSVKQGMWELLRHTAAPVVLFSPMRSKPRRVDASPQRVVRWTSAFNSHGVPFAIPKHSVVTSRATPTKRKHYALVCGSDCPLRLAYQTEVGFDSLLNIRSRVFLGTSQVTAVVQWLGQQSDQGRTYPIMLTASLLPPYFVELKDPQVV
jgi:hypothetical protein